jgi:thiamine-monophosphate kinase
LASAEELGERRIIEIIQSRLDQMPKMPVPFGDDVSACEIGDGNLVVLKTDMLVDRTDVPKGMNLWQAARKAVVMNVSDFAAKGVKPIAMLVSLGIPRSLRQSDAEELGDGLNAGAREYGAYVIGGDTGEASDLVINLSVFGISRKGKLMLRSGAKPGDLLAVTGPFGKPPAGLKILVDNFKASKEIKKTLVQSVLMPHARLKEGLVLSQTGAVSAAIDSSDGLAWSLHEIARASKVGVLISSLPVAKEAARFARINELDPSALALYGGEEYELILAVKPRLWSKAEKAVEKLGGKLVKIGKTTAGKNVLMETRGKHVLIAPKGYEHFKTKVSF